MKARESVREFYRVICRRVKGGLVGTVSAAVVSRANCRSSAATDEIEKVLARE
jgi:hypothetical protein